MGWDEVCIVCGICPSSDLGKAGPRWLLDNYYGEEEYLNITAEVVAINNDDFEETLAIVSEALSLPIYEDDETIHRLRKVMPGLCDWSGFKRCVAIGQFDGEGTTLVDDGSGYCRIPDGRQVEVRLVDGFRAGTFRWVIKEKQDGVTEELEEYSECSAYMSIFGERGHGQPNFFVTEGCYHYLQAWIDWAALSPRKRAFPSDPTPLSFGAELYEIVNSEEDLRDKTAALKCIDYDGIIDTVDRFQSYFHPARRGSQHVAKAIRDGLRKDELLPAIMSDFRCWMFVRPDIWPLPSESPQQLYFTAYALVGSPTTIFDRLPMELLLVILNQTPLPSYLSLSSTCKSLRSFLTAPSFADRIMKEAIAHGQLRWISPVGAMRSEVDRANEIFSQWAPVYPTQNVKMPEESAFHSDLCNPLLLPHFPRLAFVHACFQSDSMMNRKRIWGIAKQYDGLWMDYRTNGWKKQRFYYKP